MVLSLNIDLFNRIIQVGAPSTMWWTQLASAIAGGLAFATILTLLLTPCLLVLSDSIRGWKKRRKNTPVNEAQPPVAQVAAR